MLSFPFLTVLWLVEGAMAPETMTAVILLDCVGRWGEEDEGQRGKVCSKIIDEERISPCQV